MGHDIYGIKTEYTVGEYPSLKESVAYLRRSCFSEEKKVIYEALKATKHYNSASGWNTWEMFSKSRLQNALAKLGNSHGINPNNGTTYGYPDQIKFIEDCLKNLDKNGEIAIVFS